MTSLLRQIVAGPRSRHEETGLDLCYVTKDIIVTSGPSQTYPKRAYRNPLDRLVSFLDSQYGDQWAIWEFRAEGTGYPDEAVYGRIRHYPWPDHHPPPFRLVPMITASMRNWLERGDLGLGESESERIGVEGIGVGSLGSSSGVKEGQVERKGESEDGAQTGIPQEKDGNSENMSRDGIKVPGAKDGSNELRNLKEGGSKTEGTALEKLMLKPETEPTEGEKGGRVAVVHCKAGKGRSGTASCAYLISECDWKAEDALARFTERRMRPKFGSGVSIPSQVRWISYVDRWKKGGKKKYVDREIEVVELYVEGLKDGVQIDICGFVDDGRKIAKLHSFTKEETIIESPQNVASENESAKASMDVESDNSSKLPMRTMSKKERASGLLKQAAATGTRSLGKLKTKTFGPPSSSASSPQNPSTPVSTSGASTPNEAESGVRATLRPNMPIRISTSDVNISVQRRNKAPAVNLTMVTSVAHVWFNAFFEGQGPELDSPKMEGVFEIEWDAMDGVKGSSRRGVRALSKIGVAWKVAEGGEEVEVTQPGPEEPVPQMSPADWHGEKVGDPEPKLGLKVDNGHGDVRDDETGESAKEDEDSDFEGVKRGGPDEEDVIYADEGEATPAIRVDKAEKTEVGGKAVSQ